ncbi:MAG: DUF134 domain-containing protein [Dysgonamonadaceae bacterium]
MARPKKCRRLRSTPEIICFKPVGVPRRDLESEFIEADEYEAFKLVAYERLLQEEASLRMEISRPTFTRIYNSAIVKIARAIIEGKAIEINSIQDSVEQEQKKSYIFLGNNEGKLDENSNID